MAHERKDGEENNLSRPQPSYSEHDSHNFTIFDRNRYCLISGYFRINSRIFKAKVLNCVFSPLIKETIDKKNLPENSLNHLPFFVRFPIVQISIFGGDGARELLF